VLPTWLDRLAEGVIDDLIPRAAELTHWRVRIAMALRHRDKAHELESFREAAALNLHTDRLTGVGNRDAILAALFRETDRLQRANGTLSLVLVDLDDFGQWNSRLGGELCDDLLCQVAGRMTRLVRTYDALGRPGQDEFLLVLSGCGAMNAMQLAERIRVDVFSKPFHVAEESVTLTACFGITSSQGRSPVVVLREVEQALDWARIAGPGSIECFAGMPRGGSEPMPFLNSSHHEGLFSF
jgi:diguanylate cyclase (GGDEF)-like protein